MTKSELKNGMIVELENNQRYMVLNEHLINMDVYIFPLEWYSEDLIYRMEKKSIVKVYYLKTPSSLKNVFLVDSRLELIWERK